MLNCEMLKALHHDALCLPALPKCNLVLASPWVFCKVCPEELYYGTVKTETYFSQCFTNQVPASLIRNLTKYRVCSLGNQSSSHRNHKGTSRAAEVSGSLWKAPLFSQWRLKRPWWKMFWGCLRSGCKEEGDLGM